MALYAIRDILAVCNTAVGSIAGYDPFYWGHSMFARWLFRSAGMKMGAVQYEPGIYMLIAIMPALLYVSLSRNWTLDDE